MYAVKLVDDSLYYFNVSLSGGSRFSSMGPPEVQKLCRRDQEKLAIHGSQHEVGSGGASPGKRN